MNQTNRKYINTQRWLLHYFSQIAPLFVQGQIRFRTDSKGVKIQYSQSKFDGGVGVETTFPYKTATTKDKRDTVWLVQDFVINCYYEYEWNGYALKLKELARLVGVNNATMSQILQQYLDKCKWPLDYYGYNDAVL